MKSWTEKNNQHNGDILLLKVLKSHILVEVVNEKDECDHSVTLAIDWIPTPSVKNYLWGKYNNALFIKPKRFNFVLSLENKISTVL